MERQGSHEHATERLPSHDNRELNESRRDDRRYEPAGYDENTGRQHDNRMSNGHRGPELRGQRSGTNSGQRWPDDHGRYDRPASRGPYGEDRYERPHSRQHHQLDRSSSEQEYNRPPSRQGSMSTGYPGE